MRLNWINNQVTGLSLQPHLELFPFITERSVDEVNFRDESEVCPLTTIDDRYSLPDK